MRKLSAVFFVFLLFPGLVSAAQYPTLETVHYVVTCMAELGGQTDENLYTCSCRLDVISEKMTYVDYDDGVTFERNQGMAGKKGAFFKDNKRGEARFELLKAARKEANGRCIAVKRVATPKKTSCSNTDKRECTQYQ
jgi:hypothetical protein